MSRAAGRWDFESGVLANSLGAAFGGETSNNPYAPPPPEPTAAEVDRQDRQAWSSLDAFFARFA